VTTGRTYASKAPQWLRRYTDLSSAIDLLTNKRLTLLDPASWDDAPTKGYITAHSEAMNGRPVSGSRFDPLTSS